MTVESEINVICLLIIHIALNTQPILNWMKTHERVCPDDEAIWSAWYAFRWLVNNGINNKIATDAFVVVIRDGMKAILARNDMHPSPINVTLWFRALMEVIEYPPDEIRVICYGSAPSCMTSHEQFAFSTAGCTIENGRLICGTCGKRTNLVERMDFDSSWVDMSWVNDPIVYVMDGYKPKSGSVAATGAIFDYEKLNIAGVPHQFSVVEGETLLEPSADPVASQRFNFAVLCEK